MSQFASPDDYPRRSMRDFYSILFRHKWKVSVFFLTVMVTVTLGTYLVAEIYRAKATLLVRIGRESVTLDPTAATGQVISLGQSRQSEINSELDILRSRELALRVVDAIGPQKFLTPPEDDAFGNEFSAGKAPEWRLFLKEQASKLGGTLLSYLENVGLITPLDDREKAVIKLMKGLDIATQKNANTLSLSYDGKSPKFAEAVLSKLINFYLEKHSTVHRTPGSYSFFDQQSESLHNQLIRTEEELKELKNRSGIASLEEQKKSYVAEITDLGKEIRGTDSALSASRAKVESLRKELAGLAPTVVSQETKGFQNYGADLMRARLYELQMKEQDLLTRYTETTQIVQNVRKQIAEAKAVLEMEEPSRTQVSTALNTTHQQLDLALRTETVTLSSLESRLKTLKDQLENNQRGLGRLNQAEARMVRLQRELSLQEVKYRKYSENLEQARIDQALETNKISNISMIQAATASMKPVKPIMAFNLALGFVLALVGGLGLAFFCEVTDHSIRTPEDVEEELKLQLLASIPYLKKEKV